MRIGVPKEIKPDEYRVAVLPVGVELLARAGHTVTVQRGAGAGSGFPDDAYTAAGAKVVDSAAEIIGQAEMVIKVKEPQASELPLFGRGQIVLTYFHLAASEALTRGCLERGIIAIAYETIVDRAGHLPCLTPMSEIAGRMSVQEGAKYLEKPMGGRGVLLGGVPGVAPGNVLILGGGTVGANAARIAAGMGAAVVVMDVSLPRLRALSETMPANVQTVFSDAHAVADHLPRADLVIGAVLIPGAAAPRLLNRADLQKMQPASVIVDVAIDQGGCVETSRPTTHHEPTYFVDGILHYCVANMPGAVGRTSTIALCNATLPYAIKIANLGYATAAREDPGLAMGINLVEGRVTNSAVAQSLKLDYHPL